jgi:UDP:flavonoid glycosyltransferase YjiC (YdhE family)
MGRAAVLPYPTYGHIAPVLGVAEQLVNRGEEVVFYATGRSRAKIEATGSRFRNYGRRHDAFNPTPPTEGLFADMARLAGLTEEILPGLLEDLRALAPDYLLIDTKSLWGRLAAAVLGLPAITLSVVFAIQPQSIGAADLVSLLYSGAPAAPLLSGIADLTRYLEVVFRVGRRYGARLPGIIDYLGNPQALVSSSRPANSRFAGKPSATLSSLLVRQSRARGSRPALRIRCWTNVP